MLEIGAVRKCRMPGSWILALPLICIWGGASLVRAQEINPVNGDDSPVTLSLEYYNPQNQSTWTINTLPPQSISTISVKSAPPDVRFYVFQAHAYLHNISLSFNKTLVPHYHINGTNLGLVWISKGDGLFYVTNPNPLNVTVMYAIVAYGAYSPVPGGCNMEFEVETAPYLKVKYNHAMIEVTAQPAKISGKTCTRDMVSHDVYRMYMYERDFSVESYFAAIQSMLTPSDIISNGSLAAVPIYGSMMRRLYSLYAGTGSVYAAVATSTSGISAYVPAVTYGCSAVFFTDSCSVLTTTFSKVLCALVLFLGFFTCFFGHTFLRSQIFLAGCFSGSLLAYIGLSQWSALPIGSGVTLSSLVGAGVGMVYLMIWWLSSVPIIAILFLVTPLGFLVASLLFFVGLGDFQFAQSDLDFWLTFFLILLSVVLLLPPLHLHATMLACAVVGSYAVVATIDHYLGANLKYIVINTLRRASVPGFSQAITEPPFQAADGALVVLWFLLMVIGFRVQQIRHDGRPPFPPSWRGQPPLALPRPPSHHPNARTPLRVRSRIPNNYGSVGDDDVFETPPPPPGSAPVNGGVSRSVADLLGRMGLRGR